STLAPSTSPGCWTATNTLVPSSRIVGPQVSAPIGTVRNCLTFPRSGPSTGTENSPSFEPRALPSVEIHRLPSVSNATLSGHEIGLTFSFGTPPKYVSAAAGSPQTRNTRQANVVEDASLPASSI